MAVGSRTTYFVLGALLSFVITNLTMPALWLTTSDNNESRPRRQQFQQHRAVLTDTDTSLQGAKLIVPSPTQCPPCAQCSPQITAATAPICQCPPAALPSASLPPQATPAPSQLDALISQLHYRVPYIVERFRAGAVNTELFAHSNSSSHREAAARFFNGAIFREHDHGPLADYSACRALRIKCAVHPTRDSCMDDGFCGWCQDKLICLDKQLAGQQQDLCDHSSFETRPLPDNPTFTYSVMADGGGQLQPVQGVSGCSVVVPGVFESPHLQYEQMYYHWLYDNWSSLRHIYTTKFPPGQLSRLQFLFTTDYQEDTLHYFGLLSSTCYRFASSLAKGTCLVTLTDQQAWYSQPDQPVPGGVTSQHYSAPDAYQFVLERMGYARERKPAGPRVCILQRDVKRFLLNAEELAEAVLKLGLHAEVVNLDELPLYEQLGVVSNCTVFVAMHGSGLANIEYLPQGAGVLEIIPLRSASHTSPYYSNRVPARGCIYLALQISDYSDVLPHWQRYKPEVVAAAQRMAVLDKGPLDNVDFWTFWVNQDVRVKVPEFLKSLRQLVKMVPIHEGMSSLDHIQWRD